MSALNRPVPEWLRIHDIDDLKAKPIGVVITVLGVDLLGRAIAWRYGEDILPLGLSVATVALVPIYFLGIHFRREPDRSLLTRRSDLGRQHSTRFRP